MGLEQISERGFPCDGGVAVGVVTCVMDSKPIEDLFLSYVNAEKNVIDLCQSPIERYMFIGLISMFTRDVETARVDIFCSCGGDVCSVPAGAVVIQPQFKVGGYFADFILAIGKLRRGILIECDGHEWHEKSKEQVIADNKRNRAFRMHGFELLRFSGSEIYNDLAGCLRDVRDLILKIADEQSSRCHEAS